MSTHEKNAAPVWLDRREDDVAIVVFDLPGSSVNKITLAVMDALAAVLDELEADLPAAVVFTSGKDHFCVGADVALIRSITTREDALAGSRRGQELFARIAGLACPTVAAVQGNCLGGGYEWALACDRIVAADSGLKLGLPEVRLGILPGWGGTQRLPRRMGFGPAVETMAAGRSLDSARALHKGAVDQLAPVAEVTSAAVATARRLATAHGASAVPPASRMGFLGYLMGWLPPLRRMVFRQVRAAVSKRAGHHYPAPIAIVAAVEGSFAGGAAGGFTGEREGFADLAVGDVSHNLVGLFLLNSEARSWYADSEAAVTVEPATIAVLGAGIMGAGIANLAAGRGLQVVLRDIAPEALDGGVQHIHKEVARQVEKGRLTAAAGEQVKERVLATLDAADLAKADLIVEAVVEEMGVKKKVLAEAAAAAPDAVLATNTSALSVATMAADLPRPQALAGLHFFNPVEKMPLVEIIAPDGAAAETVGTLMKVARRLGKVPVKVGDAPGFLVNRVLSIYLAEAMAMVEEGYDFAAMDRRMKRFGMPVGPLALLDQIGLDVARHVTGTLQGAFGDRMSASDLLPRMVAAGHTGMKGGGGFYTYGGDRPQANRETVQAFLSAPPETPLEPGDMEDHRLLYPMVAEAARCLDEGVVTRPGEVDLALVMGIGWPPFTGGLLRWADSIGVGRVVEVLEKLSATRPGLAPPAALRRVAEETGAFYAGEGQGSV